MGDPNPGEEIFNKFTSMTPAQLSKIPFEEPYIGLRKIEVIGNLWNSFKRRHDERHLEDKHLWYPRPTHTAYELRRGEPPPDKRRPAHLRGLDLRVSLKDFLRKMNHSLYTQEYFGSRPSTEVRRDLLRLING